MSWTKYQRYIVSQNLKILEALYPDDAETYAKHRIAVERGYELHYEEVLQDIEDGLSEDQCREVLDILDMYRIITFSYDELSPEEKASVGDVTFPGFDGNHEPEQFGYAQYFILQLGRYRELIRGMTYPDLNSHTEILPRYRRMLKTYSEMENKQALSAKDLRTLLAELESA